MPFDVMCYDSGKAFSLTAGNGCVEDLGSEKYRVTFYCPCGCGEFITANLPSKEKFIENEKHYKNLKKQIAVDAKTQ